MDPAKFPRSTFSLRTQFLLATLSCLALLGATSVFAQMSSVSGPIGANLSKTGMAAMELTNVGSGAQAPGDVVLMLDDGDDVPDGHLGFGDGRTYYWGNVFEIGSEDARLTSLRWWMRTEASADPAIVISMFNESTGERLIDLFPTVSPSSDGRWYELSLPSLELAAREFFSVIIGASGSIPFPAGYDTDARVPGASYFSDDGQNYTLLADEPGFENAAYLIRVAASTGVEPLPDLVVSDVQAPTEAFSGTSLEVTWVVENRGTAATWAPEWNDHVYLSSDDVLNTFEDVLLGSVRNGSYLAPSEGYSSRAAFTLPDEVSGTHHILVVADGNARQPEVLEDNNTGHSSRPVDVRLTPPPDLQITNASAPREAFSGQSVAVGWTVVNAGATVTPSGEWTDAVFLSDDDVLDLASDVHLASFEHDGALAPDASYTRQESVDLPHTVSGSRYILFVTDWRDVVFEHVGEGNNLTSSEVLEITLSPPPDLVVTRVEAPTDARSGESITLSWTVENHGAGAPFESSWSDRIYLSTTSELDPGTAAVLATEYRGGGIRPGEGYSITRSIQLPHGIEGTYHLFVTTDWDNQVFEFPAEYETNNSRSADSPFHVELSPWPDLQISSIGIASAAAAGEEVSVRFDVRNAGTGAAASTTWRDAIYVGETPERTSVDRLVGTRTYSGPLAPGESYSADVSIRIPRDADGSRYVHVVTDVEDHVYEHTDETNNGRSESVAVTPYPPVDLSVGSLSVPVSGFSGTDIDVAWTVSNVGAGRTIASSWADVIYLTDDPTTDPSDGTELARVPRNGTLTPGETYERRQPVRLPHGISGEYTLHVMSTLEDAEPENSVAAAPLSIQLSPSPDLRVESLAVSGELTAGQPAELTWRVVNGGAGDASAWRDGIYLSRDGSIDPEDVFLTATAQDALAAGNRRDTRVAVQIPIYLSGSYFLIVAADYRNHVYEHLAEANNTQFAAVQITLPPPSDLVVSEVRAPASAVPGEEVTVTWTVGNIGINAAAGEMTDAVYVSSDSSWSIDDPVVGVLTRAVDLQPGAQFLVSYSANLAKTYRMDAAGNLTEELPGVSPGAYYLLVRTDIRNNIRESNDGNNAGSSSGTMDVGLPMLVIGQPSQTTLEQGQERFFAVEVPAGKTLRIGLESDSPDAVNELYARFGDVPSRSRFDASFQNPFEADQEVWIPQTNSGTYFIGARSEAASSGLQQITLQADTVSFEITSIRPARGGNVGEVTLRIEGARLDSFTTVQLRPAGSAEPVHKSKWLRLGDPSRIYATFDLRNVPPGSYDVVALSRPVGIEVDSLTGEVFIVTEAREAVLPSSFTVEPGGGAVLEARLRLPEAARLGNDFPIVLEVANLGNVDLPTPLLRVVSPNATPLSRNLPVRGSGMQKVDVLVLGPELRRDVLAPGQRSTVKFYARAANLPSSLLWLQDSDEVDPRISAADFEAYFNRFRPGDSPDAAWEAFQNLIGETADDFIEALRDAAAQRNPGFGDEIYFFGDDLIQDLVARAWGESQGKFYVDYGRSFPEVITPEHFEGANKSSAPRPLIMRPSANSCGQCELNAAQLAAAEAQIAAAGNLFEYASPWAFAGELLDHFTEGSGESIYYGPNDVYTYWGGAVAEVLAHPQIQEFTKGLEAEIKNEIQNSGMAKSMACGQSMTLRLDDFMDPTQYQLKGLDFNGESRGLSMGIGGIHSGRYTGTVSVLKLCTCNGCCESVDVTTDIQIFLKDVYDFCEASRDVSNPMKRYITYLVEQLETCGWAKGFDIVIEAPIPPKTLHIDCDKSGAGESDPECCKKRDPANEVFCSPPDPTNNDGCGDCPPEFAPLVVSGSGDPTSTDDVPSVASCDPNDMLGPAGFGDEKWISASQTLPYTIRFENDPLLATAAAQVVTVSHELDDTVDPRTFRLGSFGFGPFEFDVPENSAFFSQRLDVRDSLGMFVDATAGIDVASNEAFWVFRTIDPATGTAPTDPRAGFLAVNDSLHNGEGFVTYSIRPKPTARTRDLVDVEASIFFDGNAPIDTPPLFNTIDADAPMSTLSYVASDEAGYHLEFSGADEGSGIRDYALYVSADGGTFQLQESGITGPSAVFVPEPGHRYRAFSIASDNAGNVELMKSGGQAIVVQTEEGVELPERFALYPNYPNPFNPSTVVPFDLPESAEVAMTVYNLLGQRVAQFVLGRLSPGRHQHRVDLSTFASGVYFYEFTARSEKDVLFREVRRFVLVK